MYSQLLHEKKQHGTSDFPMAYYDIIPSHPHYCMPFHWHKEWELIRIREGSVTLHVDNHELVAQKDDIIIFHDSMLHGSLPPSGVLYDCLVFDLRGLLQGSELLKQHLRPFYHMEILPNIYYPANTNGDIYPIVAKLMEIHRQQENHIELISVSLLGELFYTLLEKNYYVETNNDTSHSSLRMKQIKSVLEYVEKNFKNHITLNDLARVANMNPRYFCRFFKQIISMTPMDYVIDFRIEHACKLLETTTLPIMQIALECGFNDCSYFTRAFRQRKKMTPIKYRNH